MTYDKKEFKNRCKQMIEDQNEMERRMNEFKKRFDSLESNLDFLATGVKENHFEIPSMPEWFRNMFGFSEKK